jgi:hypothetical protein
MYDSYESEPTPGAASGMHPGFLAGLIVGALLTVLGLVSSITGGAVAVICLPLMLLIYAGAGVLAGYLSVRSGRGADNLSKMGAIAGLVSWGISAVYYLLIAPLVGFATLGLGLVDVARWLICGPVQVAVQVALGALGAWAFGRFSGARPTDTYGY